MEHRRQRVTAGGCSYDGRPRNYVDIRRFIPSESLELQQWSINRSYPLPASTPRWRSVKTVSGVCQLYKTLDTAAFKLVTLLLLLLLSSSSSSYTVAYY